jgi:ketosteroid isomerase-like protein
MNLSITRRLLASFLLTAGIAGACVPGHAQEANQQEPISTQEKTMTNIEIAKTYIKAVKKGDQALLASVISPDVVWHQPGNNQFSGTHKGIASIGAMIGKMMEVSKGTFVLSNANVFMANGDWVAIQLEFSGQRDGIKLAKPGVDLMRIENGKIVEMRLFSSNQEEEDLFWGK